LIALRNPPDQHFVGRSLGRRCLCRQCGDPSHTGASHTHGIIPFSHVPANKLAQRAKVAPPSMPMNRLSKSAVFWPQQLSLAAEPYEILLIAVTYDRLASISVTLRARRTNARPSTARAHSSRTRSWGTHTLSIRARLQPARCSPLRPSCFDSVGMAEHCQCA
jgi:hypothetical protein